MSVKRQFLMVPELEIQAFWDIAGHPHVELDFGAIVRLCLKITGTSSRTWISSAFTPDLLGFQECRDDKQAEFVQGWKFLINYCQQAFTAPVELWFLRLRGVSSVCLHCVTNVTLRRNNFM
jgi:hypothetical protein